ncbi:MAG TPA: hypothetical protein DCS93_17075 [Microscillaceae bacterium]|nr:hypothetical protein [Microscillaceae bacterium]
MSNLTPKEESQSGLWPTYLHKIHQEQDTEPENAISRKFWKQYEALVEESKQKRKFTPTPSKVVHSVSISNDDVQIPDDDIFQKYWNGNTSTIRYDEYVHSQEIEDKFVIKITLAHVMAGLIVLGSIVMSMLFINVLFGSILFLSSTFVAIAILVSNSNQRSAYKHTKSIPAHTIHYAFQIHQDHLEFTQVSSLGGSKKLRLDYYKIKSLTVRNKKFYLKSLYHKSFKDRMNAKDIKENFCVPTSMPQGQKIINFLREILILNKA